LLAGLPSAGALPTSLSRLFLLCAPNRFSEFGARLGRHLQEPQQERIAALVVIASLVAHVRENIMSRGVRSAIPPDDDLEVAFSPYIRAAGEVVNAWNRLQETLKDVFATITKMPRDMSHAIWHSSRSDSIQRDMLRAAIASTKDDEPWVVRLPNARRDLLLLLQKAGKISETRNDAIHAPVGLALDGGKLVITPFYFNGNPRAKNLQNKDVIAEFWRCRDEAYILREFAEKAETSINFASYAWPDKPALLVPPEKQKRIRRDRQAHQE
jgi:hypothetical protein